MTRRNTYVCSERTTADRHSVIQNGKENRYEVLPVCKKICSFPREMEGYYLLLSFYNQNSSNSGKYSLMVS